MKLLGFVSPPTVVLICCQPEVAENRAKYASDPLPAVLDATSTVFADGEYIPKFDANPYVGVEYEPPVATKGNVVVIDAVFVVIRATPFVATTIVFAVELYKPVSGSPENDNDGADTLPADPKNGNVDVNDAVFAVNLAVPLVANAIVFAVPV